MDWWQRYRSYGSTVEPPTCAAACSAGASWVGVSRRWRALVCWLGHQRKSLEEQLRTGSLGSVPRTARWCMGVAGTRLVCASAPVGGRSGGSRVWLAMGDDRDRRVCGDFAHRWLVAGKGLPASCRYRCCGICDSGCVPHRDFHSLDLPPSREIERLKIEERPPQVSAKGISRWNTTTTTPVALKALKASMASATKTRNL